MFLCVSICIEREDGQSSHYLLFETQQVISLPFVCAYVSVYVCVCGCVSICIAREDGQSSHYLLFKTQQIN